MSAAACLGVLGLGLFAFFGGPGGPIDAPRGNPTQPVDGWSLEDEWHGTWRRILDRTGRPDPQGPLLQPAQHLQRPEYALSLAAPAFTMLDERDFSLRTRGARFWMHSDDEFSFMNRVQIKERVFMGRVNGRSPGAFGFRYDRQDDRTTRSNLLRLDYAFPDIRGSGAFVELRGYLRFEKQDLDLDVVTGWRDDRFGRVALHLYSIDTFNNASDGLAQNRDSPQPVRTVQEAPHLASALEVQTRRWRGFRAEAYVGGMFPAVTRIEFAGARENDHRRTQSAILGGGLLEWSPAPVADRRFVLGIAPWVVHTRHRGVRTELLLDSTNGTTEASALDAVEVLYDAPETKLATRAYGLARLDHDVDIEVYMERVELRLGGEGLDVPVADTDRRWLAGARTRWMPTRVFGTELHYLVLAREAKGEGFIPLFVEGVDHRLVTRVLLRFGPWVSVGFGVGWDLDDPNPYDQGLMTTVVRW